MNQEEQPFGAQDESPLSPEPLASNLEDNAQAGFPGNSVEPEEAETESGSVWDNSGWKPEPEKVLQALVFASQEYLSLKNIREVMGDQWDASAIRLLIKNINSIWTTQEAPFEIIEVDGSFRCRTLPAYYPWVKKLFKDQSSRRLSQASLETLAIIAYKQPITKAEIEAIRGVNVDGPTKSLLEKKLIDINGKSDSLGGSFTYCTTREFMKYFGINKVPDDLPLLSEFEELIHSQALIPQVDPAGNVREVEQPDEGAEQTEMHIDP